MIADHGKFMRIVIRSTGNEIERDMEREAETRRGRERRSEKGRREGADTVSTRRIVVADFFSRRVAFPCRRYAMVAISMCPGRGKELSHEGWLAKRSSGKISGRRCKKHSIFDIFFSTCQGWILYLRGLLVYQIGLVWIHCVWTFEELNLIFQYHSSISSYSRTTGWIRWQQRYFRLEGTLKLQS